MEWRLIKEIRQLFITLSSGFVTHRSVILSIIQQKYSIFSYGLLTEILLSDISVSCLDSFMFQFVLLYFVFVLFQNLNKSFV